MTNCPGDVLKHCHREALSFSAGYARERKERARETLDHVLEMSDISQQDFSAALKALRSQARVALHFHPDRITGEGETVVASLLRSGLYKSQFETRISAGSVSAWPGGFRFSWEERMFGGAYDTEHPADRPKYGALDLMCSADGPSPRFGSCFLLLSPRVTERCTFTYMDSHLDPLQKGTLDEFDDVLAALFTEAFERNYALGVNGLRPRALVDRLLKLSEPRSHRQKPSRNLDHYIEAQVHGIVDLGRDAASLVADPSFRETEVGEQLESLSERFGLEFHWHGGFCLDLSSVPSDFRGPRMPGFARRVAGSRAHVDARAIGEAARSLHCTPQQWADHGTPPEVTQLLKRLWHVVLRFGRWGSS